MSDLIHVNAAASTSSDLCYVTNIILMAAPVHFKMADRRGLTFLTMFSTAKCKVTAANNTLPVFKDGFIIVHRISAVGYERFKRYGCHEPGKLSDLVKSNSCQCMPNRDFF